MIADIVAASGELVIDTTTDQTNCQARISGAIRAGRVPPGKLLTSHRRNWHHLVIQLKDPPAWMTAELALIPVPGTLRNPLPLVAALRDDADRLPMKAALRSRALRLTQALAAAGIKRGHRFDRVVVDRWSRGSSDQPDGLFCATIGGHQVGVNLTEPTEKIPHVPTPSERRNAERNTWVRIPSHDRRPSGRLQMSVTNGTQYRQSVWTDGARRRLEDCLPEILQELELRAGDFEEKHQANLRQQEIEQWQWEQAIDRATARMAEAHRGDVLGDQLQNWKHARELAGYLQEMHLSIARIDDVDAKARAREWLTWARQHAADIDPLNGHLAMPEIPRPSAENLKPFLGNRSFYGPRR